MAGRLCKANISGDNCCVYLAGEVSAHFLCYLCGEIGTAIEHGQGYTKDLQLGVELSFDHPQGGHQICQSLYA